MIYDTLFLYLSVIFGQRVFHLKFFKKGDVKRFHRRKILILNAFESDKETISKKKGKTKR